MRICKLKTILLLAAMCAPAARADDATVVLKDNGGKATLTLTPATGSSSSMDMQYYQLNAALMQLNMTPDFTLAKETKQKLAAVDGAWRQAQAKFQSENADQLKAIQKEQFQAAQAKNQDGLQAATKKYMEIYAKSPKSGEYLPQLKAALPAEQLKAVEEKIKAQAQAQPREALYQYDAAGGTFTEKKVEEKK